MDPAFRTKYIRDCEEQIVQLRSDIEPLLSGVVTLSSRTAGEGWVDVTQEAIERDERTIKTYEAIVAALKAEA